MWAAGPPVMMGLLFGTDENFLEEEYTKGSKCDGIKAKLTILFTGRGKNTSMKNMQKTVKKQNERAN